jgi:serine/threonine protein phosphatase 1
VIDRLMGLDDAACLMGNHEELLLRALSGDPRAMAIFARIGGVQTMASYGVDPADFIDATIEEKAAIMSQAIPGEHVEWLQRLPSCQVNGDYMFVHAGISPGQPLEAQTPEVMRWIRGDFLDSTADHGKVIVHGHSINPEIDEHHNRIGIDTGAFFSEKLTAVALEQDQRWYIQTSAATVN